MAIRARWFSFILSLRLVDHFVRSNMVSQSYKLTAVLFGYLYDWSTPRVTFLALNEYTDSTTRIR